MAFLDKAGLERLWLHINSKLNKKVDKAEGKALSTNDYTNEEKAQLATLGTLVGDTPVADQISNAVGNKSDVGHTHDDRYYTEAEVDDAMKFVKEASGEIITVNDSADQALVGLKLYGKTTQVTTTGKNLMPVNSLVTYANRSATVGNQYYVEVNPNSEYTLSFKATVGGDATGHYVIVCGTEDGVSDIIAAFTGTEMIKTFHTGNRSGLYIDFARVGGGNDTNGWAEYTDIQLERGNTATPYEPYTGGIPSPNPNYPQELKSLGDKGNIGVTATGKNLLSRAQFVSRQNDTNCSAVVDTDRITFTSTVINNSGRFSGMIVPVPVGETVTFNLKEIVSNGNTLANLYYEFLDEPPEYAYNGGVSLGRLLTFTAKATKPWLIINYWWVADASNSIVFVEPQLEFGSTATAFEPYKDGGTLTASTPNGLPGIKVTSGGNYTDETGQQWICDERDFDKGVYRQWIKRLVLDGSESWNANDSLNPTANNYIYYSPIIDNIGDHIAMCDKLPCVQSYELTDRDNCISVTSLYGGVVYVRMKGYLAEDTVAAHKAALAQYPLTVIHPMATPIETPIPESEMAAYRAMKSQYPNTTVYNDAGAGMELRYATARTDEVEEALGLAQPDWNQNDPNANDYVKNRTHWVERSTLIDNMSIELTEDNHSCVGINPSPLEIAAEATYTVIWDDIIYNCTSYYATGPNVYCIGDASFINLSGGNEEPFFMMCYQGTFVICGDNGVHTISVQGDIVHKIDNKYIDLSSVPTNILNGSADGSLRTLFSTEEVTGTYVMGQYAFAEGFNTMASGFASHAEGVETEATGTESHAEGYSTTASGSRSHAEGQHSEATGTESHAEGWATTASGVASHAEGRGAEATGEASHAEGLVTIASGAYQHVQGQYNIEDTAGTYAHIVGNGSSSSHSNAHTLDWSGNAWFQGFVYVGGTGQTDTTAVKLITQSDMETYINETFLGGAW